MARRCRHPGCGRGAASPQRKFRIGLAFSSLRGYCSGHQTKYLRGPLAVGEPLTPRMCFVCGLDIPLSPQGSGLLIHGRLVHARGPCHEIAVGALRDTSASSKGRRRTAFEWSARIDEMVFERRAETPHFQQEYADMPRTEIYKHGEDISVVTTASDEREFIETFAEAIRPIMANNAATARDRREVVRAGYSILAKLSGYKSEVQERRILTAGRWPHPSEQPVSTAGTDNADV